MAGDTFNSVEDSALETGLLTDSVVGDLRDIQSSDLTTTFEHIMNSASKDPPSALHIPALTGHPSIDPLMSALESGGSVFNLSSGIGHDEPPVLLPPLIDLPIKPGTCARTTPNTHFLKKEIALKGTTQASEALKQPSNESIDIPTASSTKKPTTTSHKTKSKSNTKPSSSVSTTSSAKSSTVANTSAATSANLSSAPDAQPSMAASIALQVQEAILKRDFTEFLQHYKEAEVKYNSQIKKLQIDFAENMTKARKVYQEDKFKLKAKYKVPEEAKVSHGKDGLSVVFDNGENKKRKATTDRASKKEKVDTDTKRGPGRPSSIFKSASKSGKNSSNPNKQGVQKLVKKPIVIHKKIVIDDKLMIKVLQFVDQKKLGAIALINKTFYRLALDKNLWSTIRKETFDLRFPSPYRHMKVTKYCEVLKHKQFKDGLRLIQFPSLMKFGTASINLLTKHVPNVECLDFYDSKVDMPHVRMFMKEFGKLNSIRVEMEDDKEVKGLHLNDANEIINTMKDKLKEFYFYSHYPFEKLKFPLCKHLKRLFISSRGSRTRRKMLKIESSSSYNDMILNAIKKAPLLEYITLCGARITKEFFNKLLMLLDKGHLKYLKRIELFEQDMITQHFVFNDKFEMDIVEEFLLTDETRHQLQTTRKILVISKDESSTENGNGVETGSSDDKMKTAASQSTQLGLDHIDGLE